MYKSDCTFISISIIQCLKHIIMIKEHKKYIVYIKLKMISL